MALDTPRNPFRSQRYDVLTINLANPAAGNPLLWAVPANQVIGIVGVSFMVLTSAVVLNRRLYVALSGPGPLECPVSLASVDQTAGVMWQYHFALGVDNLDATANHSWIIGSLPDCMELKFGDSLLVTSIALGPLDTILNPIVRYRLWSED